MENAFLHTKLDLLKKALMKISQKQLEIEKKISDIEYELQVKEFEVLDSLPLLSEDTKKSFEVFTRDRKYD